uniref:Uncharacterized protein n=1 Tax=Aegilops tauschii TaxID=37682 RepID=N1R3U7_AEGTA
MASNQNQASYMAGETKARTEVTVVSYSAYHFILLPRACAVASGESKYQTASFLGEKTEAAKQKASETAQYAQDRSSDAAQYTKESAVAGKDKTGSVLQQAGETVVSAVVGAKDAVANTLGMGGDNTTKDTTTRNH